MPRVLNGKTADRVAALWTAAHKLTTAVDELRAEAMLIKRAVADLAACVRAREERRQAAHAHAPEHETD